MDILVYGSGKFSSMVYGWFAFEKDYDIVKVKEQIRQYRLTHTEGSMSYSEISEELNKLGYKNKFVYVPYGAESQINL